MSKTETLPLTPLNKHIDALCKSLSFGNLGHTPRPSPAEKAYIQGMRDASQGQGENAVRTLTEAVQHSRKEVERDEAKGDKKEKDKEGTASNLELLALSLAALGFVSAQTQITDSIKLYSEAVGIWEKIHGPDSPRLVFLWMDLSSLGKMANDLVAAEKFCQRAREIVEKSSGPKSLELQGVLVNLATLKSELGQTNEASELFESAISSLKEHKHPNVVMAMKIYQQHLENSGNKEKALQVQKEIEAL